MTQEASKELLALLRCVPKSYLARMSKDTRFMLGELCHEAADEIERLQTKYCNAVAMVEVACATHRHDCKCEACYWMEGDTPPVKGV